MIKTIRTTQQINTNSSGRRIALLFSSILAVCFIVSCHGKKKAGNNAGYGPPEYAVLEIVPKPATLFIDYPATIQGQQNVEIRPNVDGFIEMIYVDEGATAKKAQLLFKIK